MCNHVPDRDGRFRLNALRTVYKCWVCGDAVFEPPIVNMRQAADSKRWARVTARPLDAQVQILETEEERMMRNCDHTPIPSTVQHTERGDCSFHCSKCQRDLVTNRHWCGRQPLLNSDQRQMLKGLKKDIIKLVKEEKVEEFTKYPRLGEYGRKIDL